jgi:regulator of sigma E protease
MSLLISIIAFILILAVLVLVHEFGHFIVAKKSGIRVDEFGFGFPPRAKKLFEKNGTVFTLNWIPFGGFVKIFGENGEEGQHQKDSFASKPKLIQAAVLVAGPLFNFLFAWLILAIMFMVGSPTLYDESYADNMKNVSVAVVEVMENSPADQAEIFVGDKIISVTYENGTVLPVNTPEDLISVFNGKGIQEVVLEVERKKDSLMIPVSPAYGLYQGQENPALGIALDEVGTLRLPPHQAIWKGLEKTWNLTVSTGDFLVNLIKGLFTGDLSQAGSVTGPIGIIPVVGNAIEIGFSFLVVITALISINLAIINLLPFPALDGGRLLFILIETIKGSPINLKTSSWLNGAGFLILIGLMILVTIRDIIKLF